MPSALIYLGIMLTIITVWFALVKWPIYEAILVSFAVLLTFTGSWNSIGTYIMDGLSTSLLYSMTAICLWHTMRRWPMVSCAKRVNYLRENKVFGAIGPVYVAGI